MAENDEAHQSESSQIYLWYYLVQRNIFFSKNAASSIEVLEFVTTP